MFPDPVAELARRYGISEAHVYNLLHRGLPSLKVGRCRRFKIDETDAFFASQPAAAA